MNIRMHGATIKIGQSYCAPAVTSHVPPVAGNSWQTYSKHQGAKCVASKESFRTTNLEVVQKTL